MIKLDIMLGIYYTSFTQTHGLPYPSVTSRDEVLLPSCMCERVTQFSSSLGLEMVTVKEESEDPEYYQFNIPGNIECNTFTLTNSYILRFQSK